MNEPQEQVRVGLEYVEAVSTLLQRASLADPTHGLYEAADLQFWWCTPRSTDALPQLFWFDDEGRPEAAVIVNDFGDGSSLVYAEPTVVVIVMPDASPAWLAHVIDRGLAHIAAQGIEAVELEVDQSDDVTRDVLFEHGFEVKGEGTVVAWMPTMARPPVSPLHEGYRLLSRKQTMDLPPDMAAPEGPDRQERMGQISLYRPDLDLVVLDGEHNRVAYGIFWHDPVTAVGLVEPMGTHDDHQRRGLARHVLTSGLHRLAQAGAERIMIVFEPENAAASHLYTSVGFQPHQRTDIFAGPTGKVG